MKQILNCGQKNEAEKELFIETTNDIFEDFNINKSDRCYRNGKVYFRVTASKEVCDEYNRITESEKKKEFRNNRCEINTKNGKTIRCPDNRRCQGCKYEDKKRKYIEFTDMDFTSNESVENNVMIHKALQYFENKLNEVDVTYGKIFQYMYELEKTSEIARRLKIDEKTVRTDIRKIRKILQPIAR